MDNLIVKEENVSIHAPVKGATEWLDEAVDKLIGFNPRTREGCDFRPHFISSFQPRFNPRTREGCDIKASIARKIENVSIHAPVKGATKMR